MAAPILAWADIKPYLSVVDGEIVVTKHWWRAQVPIGTVLKDALIARGNTRKVSFRSRYFDRDRLIAALEADDPRLLRESTKNMPADALGDTPENLALYEALVAYPDITSVADDFGLPVSEVILRIQSMHEAGYMKLNFTKRRSNQELRAHNAKVRKEIRMSNATKPELPAPRRSEIDEALAVRPDDDIARMLDAF